ncbi:tetratricopeptide repeat protein [Oceanobacter antarcticus]|jgi:type IV pilus assembly protein PilF|uniref:Tetratricopeptide repeat protein n=1 Tax=Oceanobacter antarcticus TaxID=3133425 RepID=A0ABW8NKH2_9GAMM
MRQLSNTLQQLLMITLTLVLTACVTTTESRLQKNKNPDKALENYTQLGFGYLKQNRPDLARQRLQKALSIDADHAPANDAMGLVWQMEGEYDLAEEFMRKAISNDSSYAAAKHHLGRLYAQMQRYDKAEKWLETAAGDRYYDGRANAYNDLAMNYYRQNEPVKAIDSYLEALRLSPYNVDALVNASTLLFEAQRYGESRKYFDRLDRLVAKGNTRHTSHSLWLGIKLATIYQDTDKVIGLATQLKKQFPDSNEYRLYQESLGSAKD